ncbi:MAG: preprotein translocase subunit SecY [Patescibacteria group bacterium]
MANMWQALKDKDLRRRILVVLGFLAFFRFLAIIPIPAFDPRIRRDLSDSNFLGLLNIFSGGALDNVSIVMLGVGPYITASIIMQLFTMIFPSLKEMYQEDGEAGRKRFNQYSRLLAVPLAFLQGYALLALLVQQNQIGQLGGFDLFTNLIVVTGGAIFLMWIGEVVSEYGIGNGISLLIFAGIVAGVPSSIGQTLFAYDASQLPTILAFLIAAPLIIAGTVIITEAERPIPISYTKRVRGMKMYGGVSTYLPLRVNQAGVIPIIFAISILLFPSLIGQMFASSKYPAIASAGATILNIASNQWIYGGVYFLLVFLFTYFYTSVTFDPDAISSNLQKQGGFIPGIRPGPSTSDYLRKLITRITLVGALFLGAIAVLPLAMQTITGTQALALGGTALLIVVSVVIETIKQVRAQMTLREYD